MFSTGGAYDSIFLFAKSGARKSFHGFVYALHGNGCNNESDVYAAVGPDTARQATRGEAMQASARQATRGKAMQAFLSSPPL